jgi:hypothetical protein
MFGENLYVEAGVITYAILLSYISVLVISAEVGIQSFIPGYRVFAGMTKS